MNRISTLLLTGTLAASMAACGSSGTTTDAGTTPTDTGSTPTDSSTPTDAACSPPAAGDGGVVPYYQCASDNLCPTTHFTNDAMHPGFRLTYIQITAPAALASAAILSVINPTLQGGTFLWGLQMDLTAGTFRTGGLNPTATTRGHVGLGLLDGQFAFYHGNFAGGDAGTPTAFDPVSGMITVAGAAPARTASTSTAATTVNIPIFTDTSATTLLTQLPLDNAHITTVQLNGDLACVGLGQPSGGRFTESTSRWLTSDTMDHPYGTVEADITVDHAKTVSVVIGGNPVPLCNLIAGANCASDPQSGWAHQPDSMVGTAPAYHLRANFAAVSAQIAQ